MIDAYGEHVVDTLTALRDGRTVNKLGRQLLRLIEAVHTTGQPGHVVLTLEITASAGPPRMCVIADRVTVDIPVNLIDPNQDPLPFPDLDGPATDGEVDRGEAAAMPPGDG